VRTDLAAVAEPDDAGRAADLQRDDVARGEHLGAELRRLPPRAVGELGAGHAVREAQVVLDARALPGLAAGGLALDEHGAQALRRAVHRGAEARRTAADDDEVVEVAHRIGGEPDRRGDLGFGRVAQGGAVGRDDQRHVLGAGPGRRQQALALRVVDVVPAVGHGVAGEEVARAEALGRPAVADDADLVDGALTDRAPRLHERVDDRVELLLRRVPGLEQVVVDVDDVDRADRGVGVGVGGEQRAAGVRRDVHGGFEEVDAVHLGHAVVGEDGGDGLAAQRELAQRFQCVAAGLGAHDAVILAVAAA